MSPRIYHIDMSGKWHQEGDIAIAVASEDKRDHRGVVLTRKLIRELDVNLGCDYDRPLLYAICSYYLIRENLEDIDTLVVCNDEPWHQVKDYLEALFYGEDRFFEIQAINITEYRKICGKPRLSSKAHGRANSYRKRGSKRAHRVSRGPKLNMVKVGYEQIEKLWLEKVKEIESE